MLNYITFKDIPKIFKILGGGGGRQLLTYKILQIHLNIRLD